MQFVSGYFVSRILLVLLNRRPKYHCYAILPSATPCLTLAILARVAIALSFIITSACTSARSMHHCNCCACFATKETLSLGLSIMKMEVSGQPVALRASSDIRQHPLSKLEFSAQPTRQSRLFAHLSVSQNPDIHLPGLARNSKAEQSKSMAIRRCLTSDTTLLKP